MNWYTTSTVLEYVSWNSTIDPGLICDLSMYVVAAVLASLIQSKGTTSQRISAMPSLLAAASTASLDNPPAGRYSVGVIPVAAAIASLAFVSWLVISSGG